MQFHFNDNDILSNYFGLKYTSQLNIKGGHTHSSTLWKYSEIKFSLQRP